MNELLRSRVIMLCAAIAFFFVLVILILLGDGFTGKATTGTRVNISNATAVNCTTAVGPGYNTVSFACISTAEPRIDVVDDFGMWAMYQYVPGSSDPWRVHNPNLPAYVVSDLNTLSRRTGYVMMMNSSRQYLLNGSIPSNTAIPLAAGWNLAGYPSIVVRNATTTFAGLNGTLTIAQNFNNSAGIFKTYPGGDLAVTTPGEGYWINMSAANSWEVQRE
jgi:hypothetical protein